MEHVFLKEKGKGKREKESDHPFILQVHSVNNSLGNRGDKFIKDPITEEDQLAQYRR